MAILRIPEENRTLRDESAIGTFLAERGIDFERTAVGAEIAAGATAERGAGRLRRRRSAELKARGGYVTADVIDVKADTPGLDAMLARFNSEHWHDEDEVRLIVEGRGLFHIHPASGPVFAIEVEPGDLIRVPTRHASLVRPLRRPAHSRDSAVSGSVGLDAALHGQRRGRGLPAGVLRAGVLPAGASRAREIPAGRIAAIQAIVLDIEGTTTPIAFVYDVLFPFARTRLSDLPGGPGLMTTLSPRCCSF